jgi:hypothetical protein
MIARDEAIEPASWGRGGGLGGVGGGVQSGPVKGVGGGGSFFWPVTTVVHFRMFSSFSCSVAIRLVSSGVKTLDRW